MPDKPESFEITWRVEDGYVNNGPHSFMVDRDEFDPDDPDDVLKDQFYEAIQGDFEANCSYVSSDFDNFLEWLRS